MPTSYTSTPGSMVILTVTVAISLLALYQSPQLLKKFVFRPHDVLSKKQYDTLYMSGFIHGSMSHLVFNMFSFYFFAFALERRMGTSAFVLLYFLALIGSLIPTWYRHRNNPSYACLGASGAVTAVIFAYIVYFPGASLYLMLIPVPIPAVLYAIGYVLYSLYADKHSNDNINHSAHISGAVFGLLFVSLWDHRAFTDLMHYLKL